LYHLQHAGVLLGGFDGEAKNAEQDQRDDGKQGEEVTKRQRFRKALRNVSG